jgi:hypothetical protein
MFLVVLLAGGNRRSEEAFSHKQNKETKVGVFLSLVDESKPTRQNRRDNERVDESHLFSESKCLQMGEGQ